VSEGTDDEARREPGPGQGGPGSRRRRLIFFAVTGLLVVGIVLMFRGVLLPFLLAIVIAYVFAPVVGLMQKAMPRWLAVFLLYAGLLGALSAFVAVGIPRLAVEIEKLASEAPQAFRTVRDEWLPTLEREFREQMALYGEGEIEPVAEEQPSISRPTEPEPPPTSAAGAMDAGVPAIDPNAVVIRPAGEGAYQVHLPPSGILVHPEGDRNERRYRIATREPPPEEDRDVTQAFTEAIERNLANTEGHAVTVIETAQAVVRTVVRGVFNFFIMLMLSAYLLITSDRIFAFLRSNVRPERRRNFDRLLRRIDRGLSGVVRGQLLIAVVNGVLSGIGFYIFDLQYWPILTLIATVLSIIPIFGAIISSVPAVIIGLQDSVGTALLVLAWIVGIHQLEANVLNPKIMGDAAKVHPVLVIFALLAGEHLFGIVGALLAVPVLSIVQSLFFHFREVALGVPAPRHGRPSRTPPPSGD